jgi:hypothetical protein
MISYAREFNRQHIDEAGLEKTCVSSGKYKYLVARLVLNVLLPI